MQGNCSIIVFRINQFLNIIYSNKMKITRLIILLCSISICSCTSVAQVAEIPFELEDNGHIYLKVRVNTSKEVLNFIFDTGATSDLLDSAAAEKLGLESDYQQPVSGAGGSQIYKMVLNQKLVLDENIEVDKTHLVLMNLARLNKVSEKTIDGILGYSLLKKYNAKIDYDNKKLVLYDKEEVINTIGYTAVPFEFGNGIPIPQFDVSITLNNGESYNGKILFDCGAGITLMANTPFCEKNALSKRAGKSMILKSENLARGSISEEIAIKSISVGGFRLDELTVLLAHDKEGVSSYDGYLGILGSQVIKRFNVILDYKSKVLYLKPNNAFNNEFIFPLSGIKLVYENGKIVIYTVDETSPAYEMGIREGDEIISINGDSSGNIKTYNRVLKRENADVSLKIKHADGETKSHSLKLIRLL
jgi:hypothetical protein